MAEHSRVIAALTLTVYPYLKSKRMLRFEEEEQSNASKHSRLLRQPRMRSP